MSTDVQAHPPPSASAAGRGNSVEHAAGLDRNACPVCGGSPTRRQDVVRAGEVGICAKCGTWFRTPRPTFEDLLKIYDRDYYDAWGLEESESIAAKTKRATFAPIISRLNAAITASPGRARNLLDVGAATGLLLEVAGESGWTPWAVELNPFAAGELRKRFGQSNVFEGELTACDFAASSFDAVTMTDLIEHVLDIGATLRAAARLLRPGGVLCMTTPQIDSFSRRLMGRNWLHFKLEHIQYFSSRSMANAVRQAGFAEVQITANTKRLTLDYLNFQLRTYPHWALSPLVRAAHTLSPRGLRARPMEYKCGEMLVIARKAGSDAHGV